MRRQRRYYPKGCKVSDAQMVEHDQDLFARRNALSVPKGTECLGQIQGVVNGRAFLANAVE